MTAQASELIHDLGRGVSLVMVAIPGGAFMMGSPPWQGYDDERPQHRVTVSPFWLAKDLLTQAQWQAVMGQPLRCRFARPEWPVHNVSWVEAQRLCEKFSTQTGRACRLASEAEWEYACRAASTTQFNTGTTIGTEQANYNGEFIYGSGTKGLYRHVPTEGGAFAANEFGVRDMHGNLWEWCADAWHDNYNGAPVDGAIWQAGKNAVYRVARGGSWHDTPDVCRSAARLKALAAEGDDIIGFRVALSESS